jgi:hypothetical protein
VQAAWACLTVSLLLCVQETPARRRRQHHQDQDQDQDQDQEWDIQQEQEDQEQYKVSSHSEWYFPLVILVTHCHLQVLFFDKNR